MRNGSRSLDGFPSTVVRIDCERCGRAGRLKVAINMSRIAEQVRLVRIESHLTAIELYLNGAQLSEHRLCGPRLCRISPGKSGPRNARGLVRYRCAFRPLAPASATRAAVQAMRKGRKLRA
jgi:hypothetical protein